ncbi:MAG: Jag N-terminal domain-containing protein [Clostridia bacterium]|nr:Jag N-terminal domain-containing protein [Clostridia bacterium]
MAKVVEGVGKTYDEAVKNGLDKIGLSENEVTIEIVKEPKKTFFSILEPRQVKVTITEKEIVKKSNENAEKRKEVVELDKDDLEMIENKIRGFLNDYLSKLEVDLQIEMKYENGILYVSINGESSGLIIGHRGDTLEALQILVSAIANKGRQDYLKVIIDSENYREKRTNSLKELALRQANQVIKKKKSHTFEPMSAFERKAIHTALQDHPKVKTHSVGEEPYRKVVISLK